MIRQNPDPVSAFGGKTTRSAHLFALASEGQSLAVLPAAGERGDPGPRAAGPARGAEVALQEGLVRGGPQALYNR